MHLYLCDNGFSAVTGSMFISSHRLMVFCTVLQLSDLRQNTVINQRLVFINIIVFRQAECLKGLAITDDPRNVCGLFNLCVVVLILPFHSRNVKEHYFQPINLLLFGISL